MTEGLVSAPVTDAPLPSSPAAARDRVDSLLRAQLSTGSEAIREDVVWADALLVTSELVTNAYRHGGGLTAFSAEIESDALLLSVADRSPEPPIARSHEAGSFTAGGYGWLMVNRLAKSVSVTTTSTGKRIDVAVSLT